MKNIPYSVAGLIAGINVTNIPLNQIEICPLFRCYQFFNFIKIVLMARGKVIKTHNFLIKFKERFQKIRSYKPSYSCNQPGRLVSFKFFFKGVVFSHCKWWVMVLGLRFVDYNLQKLISVFSIEAIPSMDFTSIRQPSFVSVLVK